MAARLRPSASSRWVNCPPSVDRAAKFADDSGDAAKLGTVAHGVAAHCLSNDQWEADSYLGATPTDFAGLEDPDYNRFPIDQNMVDSVNLYLDTVLFEVRRDPDAELYVEEKLDASHIDKEISGTADAVVYKPGLKELAVVVFKHGENTLVTMREWWQGRIYGSAAYRRFKKRGVKKVIIVIVQPRCSDGNGDRVRYLELSPFDLFELDRELRHAAQETRNPIAEAKAGAWCKYCPARFGCAEREAFALSVVSDDVTTVSDPQLMPKVAGFTPAELGERVRLLPHLKSWIKDVEESRDYHRDAGNVLPGTKAVAGKNAREWMVPLDSPSKRLMVAHELGVGLDDLTTVAPKSVAQVEKLAGKPAVKAAKGKLWRDVPGKPRLVPIDDETSAPIDLSLERKKGFSAVNLKRA